MLIRLVVQRDGEFVEEMRGLKRRGGRFPPSCLECEIGRRKSVGRRKEV
jgi:hypothetical protein